MQNARQEKFQKYGNGYSFRDYTYIDDIVDGIIGALKFEKKEAVQNAVLNSNNEIKQLKSSSQKLREEIEKIIQNYENKLKKD